MDKKLFDEFKQSLHEMVDHSAGKRHDLRVTTMPRPPKKLTASEIADVRAKLNASQSIFAGYLNVSVKTVQAWEQGIGKPSGSALRLLSIIKKKPEVLFET